MKTIKLFLPPALLMCVILCSCGNNNPVTNSTSQNIDTPFVNYIIVIPTGGSADTLYFTDRNLCRGSYSGTQNNTYCLMNDTATSQSVSVTFDGNAAGSPAFTFGFLSYMGGSFTATSITGSVSLYEAVGGKIKGSFSGTFTDGAATYQCRGEFTVNRTQ
ncbi:MAG: hypothetical protein IT281_06775 [Ignavibacteria bacterium]|nr:hypothetical protein [Ignavibacteria bacterium]MCC7159223.1 hypothetical protein [Ignavibacteria bacterium]